MSNNKMLIDASHQEETRVAVIRSNKVDEFDFESEHKVLLKGNIYLAKVTRVEPSLQAAFIEYGGNRHGFLAFNEIHPAYYQIPIADKEALMKAQALETQKLHEQEEQENILNEENDSDIETIYDEEYEEDVEIIGADSNNDNGNDNENDSENENEDEDETTDKRKNKKEKKNSAAESKIDKKKQKTKSKNNFENEEDEVPMRRHAATQYKIQEVIKRRQILLIQVVKEERGNKGAAMTTYISLAGRYCVLMPNTARGGGISRKIMQSKDRNRLKAIATGLKVPDGMGVIVRTAGASKTKKEIDRDFQFLLKMWEKIRERTLDSIAPTLIHEEANLIKRSIRDLYGKNTGEIIVDGERGHVEATEFMKNLIPEHVKNIKLHKGKVPLFTKMGVEEQLDEMLQPQVILKSGGYLVINQAEALVAIDVNSGKATRQNSIEETAIQTNLEAAQEIARQLRLRDLSGLVVIDFIDMEDRRNNRAVERKLKDALKNDKARIQLGRISPFGLLEMSRQRLRASMLESTTQLCPTCQGVGHIRSDSRNSLSILRSIEEFLSKSSSKNIKVRMKTRSVVYIVNHKRESLNALEQQFGIHIEIVADNRIVDSLCEIEEVDCAATSYFTKKPNTTNGNKNKKQTKKHMQEKQEKNKKPAARQSKTPEKKQEKTQEKKQDKKANKQPAKDSDDGTNDNTGDGTGGGNWWERNFF